MSVVLIRECASEGPEFRAVLLLLKQAKRTVGFLPDSAVRDRAERGTLLIAVDGVEIAGYVLYDLPRNEVRIVQLVVATPSRRQGTARLLVDEVARRNPARRGISLHCRRDFDARDVWPRLGFTPLDERAGRGSEGKPLTAWWRDFQQPTLFSHMADEDERPVAALDANVVIDLSERAETTSRYLAADWVAMACRLGVTDEVYVELERHDAAAARVRHKRSAAGLEQLSCAVTSWRSLEMSLVALLGDRATACAGDIRHASKAAAGHARWFVTRDDKFRRACGSKILEACGLSIVSPTAFVRELDRHVRGELYRPADLAGSDIEIRSLAPDEVDEAARTFLNQRDGERLRTFRAQLNDLAADTHEAQVVVFARGGELVALSATVHRLPKTIAICRVRPGRATDTIARHVLGWLRTSSSTSQALVLADPFCGQTIVRAATEEGFLEAPRGSTAFAVHGFGTVRSLRDELALIVQELGDDYVPPGLLDRVATAPGVPTATLALEATFHPYSVIDGGLPTFLVPIKHAWASELLDPSLSRAQLFRRQTSLALQREHIYYRSPRSSGGLKAPARILWYVSGQAQGGRAIRAVSHLEEVVVGDARRLHRRFAHLGVYTESQVRAAAHNGQVMALRFSRTRALGAPVKLADYRQAVADHRPGSGLALAGPQPVPEQVFVAVVTMSA